MIGYPTAEASSAGSPSHHGFIPGLRFGDREPTAAGKHARAGQELHGRPGPEVAKLAAR